jgi:hypothetical protein
MSNEINRAVAQRFMDEFSLACGSLPIIQVTVCGGYVAIKHSDSHGSQITTEFRDLRWPKIKDGKEELLMNDATKNELKAFLEKLKTAVKALEDLLGVSEATPAETPAEAPVEAAPAAETNEV